MSSSATKLAASLGDASMTGRTGSYGQGAGWPDLSYSVRLLLRKSIYFGKFRLPLTASTAGLLPKVGALKKKLSLLATLLKLEEFDLLYETIDDC